LKFEIVGVDFDKELLFQHLKEYIQVTGIQMDWKKIRTIPIHYLINLLSMNLPFNSVEKQALLESATVTIRWENLITLLKMNEDSNPIPDSEISIN